MHPSAEKSHLSVARPSLVRMAADALRQAIQDRRFARRLPGERELVALLKVSRPTVRSALKILESENLLERRPRAAWKLKATSKKRARTLDGEVAILSPFPLETVNQHAPFVLHWLDPIKDALVKIGYRLSFYGKPACYQQQCEHALAELTKSRRVACWLLYNSTAQMQRWFRDNGIRHIILGTAFEAGSGPSIDFEQAAICRHAVAHLRKMGHRHIGLIAKTPSLAGDVESFEAFCRTSVDGKGEDSPIVELHDGSFEKILHAADKMIDRRLRPSAILTLGVPETVTAFTRILQRGLSIPRDISVIARDYHPVLNYLTPSLSYYMRNPDFFANRLFLLLQPVLAHAPGDYQSNVRLYADLIEGASIARQPAAKDETNSA